MAARQKAPKKAPGPRSDDDSAAIRQRKGFRRAVMRAERMTIGVTTITTYATAAPTAPAGTRKAKKEAAQPRMVAQHRQVERVTTNPSNRNARVRGMTVGDAWKLAKVSEARR